jgi:hypothetical protein
VRYWEIKGQPVWIEENKKFQSMGLFTAWLTPPDKRIESKEGEEFYAMSLEDRQAYNKQYSEQTWHCRNVSRHDPVLVQVVEELGYKANGRCAELDIIEIPYGLSYVVEEYDGKEWISETHRTWS